MMARPHPLFFYRSGNDAEPKIQVVHGEPCRPLLHPFGNAKGVLHERRLTPPLDQEASSAIRYCSDERNTLTPSPDASGMTPVRTPRSLGTRNCRRSLSRCFAHASLRPRPKRWPLTTPPAQPPAPAIPSGPQLAEFGLHLLNTLPANLSPPSSSPRRRAWKAPRTSIPRDQAASALSLFDPRYRKSS